MEKYLPTEPERIIRLLTEIRDLLNPTPAPSCADDCDDSDDCSILIEPVADTVKPQPPSLVDAVADELFYHLGPDWKSIAISRVNDYDNEDIKRLSNLRAALAAQKRKDEAVGEVLRSVRVLFECHPYIDSNPALGPKTQKHLQRLRADLAALDKIGGGK